MQQHDSPPNDFAQFRSRFGLSLTEMATLLNTSLYALVRWERGDLTPNPEIYERLHKLLRSTKESTLKNETKETQHIFASRGSTVCLEELPLFPLDSPQMLDSPRLNILECLYDGTLWNNGTSGLDQILSDNDTASTTIESPAKGGVSAGKNTYTYDAHTYHTKVPPQGIADIINRYLPDGGLVLDIFSGSGMTGVAALATGHDVILNELSPAASFISYIFTKKVDVDEFHSAIHTISDEIHDIRRALYTTKCRECDKSTEILYTVWSYEVACTICGHLFVLWDHCRKYGRTVREHKLLRAFPCPNCNTDIKKSSLPRYRNFPVFLGYKCCSKAQVEHPLSDHDLQCILNADNLAEKFRPLAPTDELPEGVNLGQPKRHGLTSIDRFYTPRNLVAVTVLWRIICRIRDPELAAAVAFVFTSLYQRITRLSEYRFWGGSGNTANFNVPYISNEANVFVTFLRKAKAVADHFSTTAMHYSGNAIVRTGSATDLLFLPNDSVDFIFTDPPFGANINYREMNILWESWLGFHTDVTDEAIVSRTQGKGIKEYQQLLTDSFSEAYRVLRFGHWMVVVFMNSSGKIWEAIRSSIVGAGFDIQRIDIFDKQHGTFKQYVSENTAGSDLMIHCRKISHVNQMKTRGDQYQDISKFVEDNLSTIPIIPFLHVRRNDEVDYRTLYSKYVSAGFNSNRKIHGFARFRKEAKRIIGDVS